MANDKIFANGFLFKRNDNAPQFVVGAISIKADEAIQFIEQYAKNGWVNLKVNQAQSGKYYIELDTWEAKGGAPAQAPAKAPAPKAQPQTIHLEPEGDGDSPF
jgi:hypothetical protein